MATLATAPSSAAPPSTLAELEADIRALIVPGPTQTFGLKELEGLITGKESANGLIAKMLGPNAVRLGSATVTADASSVTITGTLSAFGSTFTATTTCTITGHTPQFELSATQGATGIMLSRLVSEYGVKSPNLPDVSIAGLTLAVGTSKGDFLVSGSLNWPVPFGNASTPLLATANISIDSNSAVITGTLVVGANNTFTIACHLHARPNQLTGSWTNIAGIGWENLAQAAGVGTSALPSCFAGPTFVSAQLTLNFVDKTIQFLAQTSSGSEAFLVLSKTSGAWAFAVGAEQGSGSFTPDSPLDFLSLRNVTLIYSSYADTSFIQPYAGTKVPDAIDLEPGLTFSGDIDFSQPGSKRQNMLKQVTGPVDLNLSGYLAPGVAEVTATITPPPAIPNSRIKMTSTQDGKPPCLSISVNGDVIDFKVSAGVLIPIDSGNTLKIDGSFEITEINAVFTLDASFTPPLLIHAPVGLNGMTLQDIGGELSLIFEPPSIGLALEAGFSFADVTATEDKVAFDLSVGPDLIDPIYFYLSIPQQLTLPILVKTITGLGLPAFFDEFSLQNVLFSYCDSPGYNLPDGTPMIPGLKLGGDLKIFSFELDVDLQVQTPTGPKGANGSNAVSGAFHMTPISLPGGLATQASVAAQAAAASARLHAAALSAQLEQARRNFLLGALPQPSGGFGRLQMLPAGPVGFGAEGGALAAVNALQMSASAAQSSAQALTAAANLLPHDLVVITGVNTPGPSFAFSTSNAAGGPMAAGGINISILGANVASLDCSLSEKGVMFSALVKSGATTSSLGCTVLEKSITGYCILDFSLSGVFSLLNDARTYLGLYHVAAMEIKGSLFVTINAQEQKMALSITFVDGGVSRSYSCSFTVTSNELEDIAVTVAKQIQADVTHVFSYIVGDVSAWGKAAAAGLISDTDSIVNDANSDYGKAYKAAGGVLHTVDGGLTTTGNKIASGATNVASAVAKGAKNATGATDTAIINTATNAGTDITHTADKVGKFFKHL